MNLQQKIKKAQSERGFTIVELLIVIVVIGILAAIIIVAYNGVTNKAHTTKSQAVADTVIKKVQAYNAEEGSFPTTTGALTSASSDKSYYLSGATLDTAALSAKPADETHVVLYSCDSSKSMKVGYWDYGTKDAAYVYTEGATSSSSCTIVPAS